MQNLVVMLTFDHKYPFVGKFGPENQNFQFKLQIWYED